MIVNVRIEHHHIHDIVIAYEASLMVEGPNDASRQGEEFHKIIEAINAGISNASEES